MLNQLRRVTTSVASHCREARFRSRHLAHGVAWIKMAHRSQVVSNAFLTDHNTADRIWLIVLNHTVPAMTRWVWDRGEVCSIAI